MSWNTVLPAAKNNFLIVTFRFRVIQLTKLPRIFVERSEELQVSCDPTYNPQAGKGGAHFCTKNSVCSLFCKEKTNGLFAFKNCPNMCSTGLFWQYSWELERSRPSTTMDLSPLRVWSLKLWSMLIYTIMFLDIWTTVTFWRTNFRAVVKRRGPGISPGYYEHSPWLLSKENRRKISRTKRNP